MHVNESNFGEIELDSFVQQIVFSLAGFLVHQGQIRGDSDPLFI